MLSITLWLLSVLVPLQIFIGDQHGLNTLEHQPAKLAAIEAHWETGSSVPLILFTIPDDAARPTASRSTIPYLGSLILTHSLDGDGQGPEGFSARPAAAGRAPFFAFRIMVGIGLLMLGLVVVELVAALARPAVRQPAVPARLHVRRRRSASSRCSPAGRRPRSAGSPGSSTG